MDKINFNKFIWFARKKIYNIYFLGGFPVAEMKMKNDGKKICSEAEIGWATAHLSHDTMELYRDTAVLGAARGPRHGQDSTTTWPSLLHDTAIRRPRYRRRERPRGASQAPPVFDQQAFAEAVGITTATIA